MRPGRKPIDRFSWELLKILRDTLTQPELDRELFDTRTIATLSESRHVRHLLFRDYQGKASQWTVTLSDGVKLRFHDEATRFFYAHFCYRLGLAPKPKAHAPGAHVTNMHRLFLALCRYGSAAPMWQEASIVRSHRRPCQAELPEVLVATARRLARLCGELGTTVGALARRRRQESGPIWLLVNGCALELPEELSLLDVLGALPLPLRGEFVESRDVQLLLTRVMDAVSERYSLLRACGLPPDPWLERKEPSIGALRQVRMWRRRVSELVRAGTCTHNARHQAQAFAELKGGRRKFAGVSSFHEFARTEYGAAVLGPESFALDLDRDAAIEDGHHDGGAPHGALYDMLGDECERLADWLDASMASKPALFSPVMQTLLTGLLKQERTIAELIGEPGFQSLLQADDAYAGLALAPLATVLQRDALHVIQRTRPRRIDATLQLVEGGRS